MPVAQLPAADGQSAAVRLAYIDSWNLDDGGDGDGDGVRAPLPRVQGRAYTTIIALHGAGFDHEAFRPLARVMPPTVRLLVPNQRSYPGSSAAYLGNGVTDMPVDDASSKPDPDLDPDPAPARAVQPPRKAEVARRYAEDVAGFVRFVVDELGVPSRSVSGSGGGREGGVVLLGWSKGTVPLLSIMLSLLPSRTKSDLSPSPHLTPLPPTLQTTLDSHVRAILLYEPPGSALGRVPTPDYTAAMNGPGYEEWTKERFANAFRQFILGVAKEEEEEKEKEEGSGAETIRRSWHPECVAHAFSWNVGVTPDEGAALCHKAFTEDVRLGDREVGVGYLYGTASPEYVLDAVRTVRSWVDEQEHEHRGGEEKEKRKLAFVEMPGLDHFAMAKDPRGFLRFVLRALDEVEAEAEAEAEEATVVSGGA